MQPLLNIAITAARNASKIITRSIGRLNANQISEKQLNDYVTEVDMQAEKEIVHTIRKSYPDHLILTEESGLLEGDDDTFTWIVDPLDGTTNYIHGIPHYAISIAIKYKGKLEHGVIYDPLQNELFIASRGDGARLNDRRMRVSVADKLDKSLIGTGFPYRYTQDIPVYLRLFGQVLPQVGGMRRSGSAALDLAYVAAGRLDGFWELGLEQWDMAAGALMIKEAGGLVTDIAGGDDFLKSGNIVAGNLKITKGLLQLIKG